jgi:hypothetical protein
MNWIYIAHWIDGKTTKWNCEHIFKEEVLIDTNGILYEWNTDYDEPKNDYRYISLKELYPERYGKIDDMDKFVFCRKCIK